MWRDVDTLRGKLQEKYRVLRPVLDERSRRLWAASEAHALGRGGISRVAEATGLSRSTIRAGLKELETGITAHPHITGYIVIGFSDTELSGNSALPVCVRRSVSIVFTRVD